MHLLLERLQGSVSLGFFFLFFFFFFFFSSSSPELDGPSEDVDGSGDEEEDKISCLVDLAGPVKMGMPIDKHRDITKTKPKNLKLCLVSNLDRMASIVHVSAIDFLLDRW